MLYLYKIKYLFIMVILFLKKKERIFNSVFSLLILSLLVLPAFLPVFSQTTANPDLINNTNTTYTSSNLGDWLGAEGECAYTPSASGQVSGNNIITTPVITEQSGPGNSKYLGNFMAAITNRILGCYYQQVSPNGALINERYIAGGALSVGSSALGTLYTTPSSSLAYQVEQTIALISPVKTAEAQGLSGAPTGASILQFVKTLHTSVSNLVYVVYVFIFLVISITILLRKKINGQEFVNIMNFIPRIIISLILVVFSYSISGLIIDVSNIGMGVVYDIFVNNLKNTAGDTVADAYAPLVKQNLQPFHPDMSIFRIFGMSQAENPDFNVSVQFVTPDFGPSNGLITSLADTITTIAGQAGTGLSGLIGLILAVGALSSMFKIFFALLKDFLTLLFYPVLAPIQFALMIFPGQEKGAIEWAKTMLGSSLTFVAMYAVFFLIFLLGRDFFNVGNGTQIWNPPLLGFAQTPDSKFISYLAAYCLYVISAGIPDMVKGALKLDGGAFGKVGAQLAQTTRSAASKVTFGLLK